jgi:hypothetical protein
MSTGGAFGQGWGDAFSEDGFNNRRGSMTAEQAMAAYTEELKQATLQSIQAATDIPESVMALVRGKDIDAMASAEIDGLLQQINELAASVSGFRVVVAGLPPEFAQLHDASFDVAAAIIEASGGLQNFSANLESFYSNFFTAEERQAQQIANLTKVFEGLGVQMPTTMQAFRDLVLAQDLSTESGRRMYAELLRINSAFAEVTRTSEAATVAVERQAEAVDPNIQYVSQGDVAAGWAERAYNAAEAFYRERADAINEEIRGLQDTIRAHQQYADALKRFRADLTMGPLAQLSPEQAYQRSKAEFERLSKLDVKDPERLAGLEEAGRRFLEASKGYNASSEQYFMDLAKVLGSVEASETAARSAILVAEDQLAVLREQLDGIRSSAEYLRLISGVWIDDVGRGGQPVDPPNWEDLFGHLGEQFGATGDSIVGSLGGIQTGQQASTAQQLAAMAATAALLQGLRSDQMSIASLDLNALAAATGQLQGLRSEQLTIASLDLNALAATTGQLQGLRAEQITLAQLQARGADAAYAQLTGLRAGQTLGVTQEMAAAAAASALLASLRDGQVATSSAQVAAINASTGQLHNLTDVVSRPQQLDPDNPLLATLQQSNAALVDEVVALRGQLVGSVNGLTDVTRAGYQETIAVQEEIRDATQSSADTLIDTMLGRFLQ